MKKTLSIILLLVSMCCLQPTEAQDIIMGTISYVGDIDDQPRYFYDPGGTSYFAQGLRDTITLRTTIANTQLYVLFEEFAMGDGDTLWIYDGDAAQCDINHLRGYYNLVNSPREVLAIGREMTFVFHSDSMDIQGLQDGWKAQVYAYDPVPLEINYGDWTTVITSNAIFYDAGGPNGTITSNGTPANNYTEFTSPLGTHIKCEFTQFSVGGVLKMYDGQFNDVANRRLIGQFCTSTLDATTNNMPPIFFSSTNTLSFEYVSGGADASKQGWRAIISNQAELFKSETGNPCPSVDNIPGGLYADSPNPKVIEFDCSKPVVLLQANVIATGQYTNDYTVEQIPYNEEAMLFGYDAGPNIVNANTDDEWLGPVALPFSFSFFGNRFTTLYPSSNGIISFNPHTAGSFCEWDTYVPPASPPYSEPPYFYAHSAYEVYEDINPNNNSCSQNGTINYGVVGQYPCRAFLFNYNNMGLFSCCSQGPSMYNTYQMVFYEGTCIIDVYIKHRACCTSWNDGLGVIGLQNKTSSQILTVPGRNFNSTWTVNNGEAWRFTPITPLDENGELTWYKDTVDANHIISYDPQARTNRIITVSPTDTSMYISEYRYINAALDEIVLRDTTLVLVPEPEPIDSTGVAVRSAGFEVYPNPTHDAVYVKLQNTCEMPSAFEVLDLNGRLLFAVPAEETTRVDLSRLPVGVYLLRAVGGKGTAVKITKQ